MKNIGRGIISVLFILFLYWATRGNLYTPFSAFWPNYHILLALCVIALILTPAAVLQKVAGPIARLSYFILPLISFFVPLGINLFVFHDTPHPVDEAHYLWIAKNILHGSISAPLPDYYEMGREAFLLQRNGTAFSLFLPGYSLVLAPFLLFKVTYLANPLFTAVSCLLTGVAAKRITGKEYGGVLSMLFFTASYFHVYQGALYFPHPLTMMLTLAAVLLLLPHTTVSRALIASLLCGFIIFIRPQDAVFVFGPLALWALISAPEQRFKLFAALALPFGLCGAGLLFFNHLMTGDIFMMPQDLYHTVIEENPFCHRIGIHTVCEHNNPLRFSQDHFGTNGAFHITKMRLSMFLYKLPPHPLVLFFALPAVLLYPRRHLPGMMIFLACVGGYLFFYMDGIYYGARYYANAGPLFLIAAVDGILTIAALRGRFWLPLMTGFSLSVVLFLACFLMPDTLKDQSKLFFYNNLAQARALLKEQNISDSLVLMPLPLNFGYTSVNPMNLADFGYDDKRGNRFLYSAPLLDEQAALFYATKGYKQTLRFVEDRNTHILRLEPVTPAPPVEPDIEFENKFTPVWGNAAYGFPVVIGGTEERFGIWPQEGTDFSMYFVYGLKFKEIGPSFYYTVPHTLIYDFDGILELRIIKTPCGGRFTLTIDNRELMTFSSWASAPEPDTFGIPFSLPKGRHRITVTPLEPNSCVVLDRLRFIADTPVCAAANNSYQLPVIIP